VALALPNRRIYTARSSTSPAAGLLSDTGLAVGDGENKTLLLPGDVAGKNILKYDVSSFLGEARPSVLTAFQGKRQIRSARFGHIPDFGRNGDPALGRRNREGPIEIDQPVNTVPDAVAQAVYHMGKRPPDAKPGERSVIDDCDLVHDHRGRAEAQGLIHYGPSGGFFVAPRRLPGPKRQDDKQSHTQAKDSSSSI